MSSLCVSLSSGTVLLHDDLGSRHGCACSNDGFSSKYGDSAREVCYLRVAFCCAFSASKRTNVKDSHNEIFPVYCGNCFSCKAFHNWFEKFSQGRSKFAHDVRPGAKLAETRFLCCEFERPDKAMDIRINAGGGYIKK
jgi:hypothetical protein